MTVIQSCVKIISGQTTLDYVYALCKYPKIVIIEGKKTLYVLDVTDLNDITTKIHSFQNDIIHQIIFDGNVWLASNSGELFVLNLKSEAILEFKYKSNANYKIRKFALYDSKLIMISEGGERLHSSITSKALEAEFHKGTSEISILLEKAAIPAKALCDETKNYKNGVNISINLGKLVINCPLTGLSDVITMNTQLQYVTFWNEMTVVASNMKMFLLNQNFDLVFEFENTGHQYFPLASYNDLLYYISWNKDEIGLHYASLSTSAEQNINFSIGLMASSQDTLKIQLKSLVEQSLSNSITPDQILSQLQVFFSDIDDFDFLVNIALTLCNHNLLYKPILYPLQKRIYATGQETYINFISDIIIKTDLLEYICFKGGASYENINIFEQKFIELCVTFIKKSDLDLATICWLKYTEIKQTLNSDDVNNILNAIPYNIKMGALVIWFRNFVPPLLDENPFYIDLFVKWTTDRVFLLEQSPYWPKIGLKFIAAIIDILETSIKTISVRPISIDDLDIIKDHIMYIMELKEKYKINMLLSEFSSQSPSEIALIMLRRCYTEDLEQFLQESLPSYTSRHLLEIDDTIRSFVDSEAASSGGYVDGNRLKILLNAFHSPTNKLDCLLNVLKVLDVPWDTNVLTTATTAAALTIKDFTLTHTDRTLAQEIYKELNYSKIKVILKKYNFHLTCTDYILVIHKLINAPTVDLGDLKVITSILTTFANYANALYIDRCLRDCDTKLALKYFKNLCTRNQRIIIKTIQNKYEQIITTSTMNPLLERNYTDFFKGSLLLDNIEINCIENLYYLKNSYSILLNLNSINSNKHCISALKNIKENGQVTSSSGRGRCILELIGGDLYQQLKLMSLLRRTSSCQNVRVLVESLILTNISNENDMSVLFQYKDGQNSTFLIESYEVLSEVLTNCEEEHLHHLLNYLSILNAMINASAILKNLSIAWKFQYIFLPMSSLNALNDLINYYTSSENISWESECSNIFQKSDFIPFRVIANVLKTSINTHTTLPDSLFKMRDKVTKKLLAKILALQDFDQVLVTSLLLALKKSEITEDKLWVLELLRGQSETLSPAAIYYLSIPHIRRTFELENVLPRSTFSCPPEYILKSKFNINLSEIPLPENTEETWDVKVLLFYILRSYPYTTFERLSDLCQTLNISHNYGFSLLLISLLTRWDLKYTIVENELGFRRLSIENNFAYLFSKCMVIWQSIDDKEFIKDILNDFWKNGELIIHGCLVSINPYYYEVYLCIYNMIFSPNESKNFKEYYLLNFLKGYQRKSSPKQYEFELFSVKGMFPEIGYYRLPFHLFMRDDMWSNLKSEITLETYEYWLPVVGLLSLDEDLQTARDMICSNAVKQTMTSHKRHENNDIEAKDNEPWRLTSLEEPLLRTAHRCVRHIANMEWAGACLFYVLQGCARGADQVAAAHLCYQFSQRWASLQPGNRAVRQMERLHSSLSTRHALYKIEWAIEELLRLSAEPAQLIHALYLHPNFVEKISRHDINRAANEIADKNGINISSIRIQILENILDKTYKENKSIRGLEMKDLITTKYILKATCPKMGAIYLSRIAFDDESDHNKCKKLRALQCLISVIDSDTAMKVTNRQRNALWLSLLDLLYIVKLEKVDVPWVVATFMQNKTLALSQLLQVTGNNIESLKIAAELAHKFGTVQLMREIVPMLLRASLFEDLVPLLLKVQNPPDKLIYSAWRAIMLSPFQRADYPITDRQKTKCINTLNLLPVCPVIKDEDLVVIWKHCIRCKCLGLGCLILPYMASETRQNLSELHRIDKRNLIISLKNLHTESYLVSGAMYVVENLRPKLYR